MQSLDIEGNRAMRKYSRLDMIRRVAWSLMLPLFRLTPRPAFALRAALLRAFGARLGAHVHVYNSATIYFPWNLQAGDWTAIGEDALIYNLGEVVLGQRVTISHRAHLCAGTHDYTRPDLPLLKPPIRIEDEAWIATEAFVGPGITVGCGAVVGARSVVVEDVAAWTVVAGNPARPIKQRVLRSAEPGA